MNTLLRSLPVLIFLAASRAMGCVGCREPGSDAIANEPQTALAGFGFSWGVIIMLGVFFAVMACLIATICTAVARTDRAHSGGQ
jgi:hypothetical protein